MSNLNIGPPKSSSSLPAFLIAAVVLLAVAGVISWRYVHHVIHATIARATAFPIHTDFSSATIETRHAMEDDLYVLVTLHVQNDNTVPVFIKAYKATLLNANGEQSTSEAVSAKDVASVLSTFPKMKPLASPPLELETTIAPGASAEGMVLLQFPITKDTWDKRKSATLTVDFYHQEPVTLNIP